MENFSKEPHGEIFEEIFRAVSEEHLVGISYRIPGRIIKKLEYFH